ncbi:flavodoxin FldB [Amphritea opalescens]|uniref:Flavodoxin n=1 Tax=Amphritea opalescens TaxID=2490544 RepID=A0A430KSV8_9GAMM|nr:flavodoxin FldB [Amphritea opalescens]RTE66566.1 flavodoxin FldB [Amphritea opalescens]
MSKEIGLFYGSTTGNTESCAELIATHIGFDRVDLHELAAEGLEGVSDYRYLIFGIPTWDYGELQEDWSDVWAELDELDLNGVKCALFGLGDQIGYGEWFLDAMGALHDKLVSRGAIMCGYFPIEGFNFEASKALTEEQDCFVGLALDEDCQNELTADRVARWVPEVLEAFAL